MILGIGTDLCSIQRMAQAIRHTRFLKRVFVEEECAYAFSKKNPARHLASSFAAKEAFAKAGGWGLGRMGLQRVWLRRNCYGKPVVCWNGDFSQLVPSIPFCQAWVSVSHEGDFALAVVVLEGNIHANTL